MLTNFHRSFNNRLSKQLCQCVSHVSRLNFFLDPSKWFSWILRIWEHVNWPLSVFKWRPVNQIDRGSVRAAVVWVTIDLTGWGRASRHQVLAVKLISIPVQCQCLNKALLEYMWKLNLKPVNCTRYSRSANQKKRIDASVWRRPTGKTLAHHEVGPQFGLLKIAHYYRLIELVDCIFLWCDD